MRVRLNSVLCGILILGFAIATALAQDTNFSSGPQYLATGASSIYARPISTPTLSLSGPPIQVGASDATGVLIPGAADEYLSPPRAVALPKIDLFPIFYGDAPVSNTEINFYERSGEASAVKPQPSSILNIDVSQEATPKALRERGYGVPLGDAASFDRTHTRHAVRVYTNADIDRLLRGGS
jgi:hypothetical protein